MVSARRNRASQAGAHRARHRRFLPRQSTRPRGLDRLGRRAERSLDRMLAACRLSGGRTNPQRIRRRRRPLRTHRVRAAVAARRGGALKLGSDFASCVHARARDGLSAVPVAGPSRDPARRAGDAEGAEPGLPIGAVIGDRIGVALAMQVTKLAGPDRPAELPQWRLALGGLATFAFVALTFGLIRTPGLAAYARMLEGFAKLAPGRAKMVESDVFVAAVVLEAAPPPIPAKCSASSPIAARIRNRRSPLRTDRIDRLPAAEHTRDVGGAFALQFLQRLDRIEGGVRRDDHVVAAEQGRLLGERLDRHHV